MDKLTYFVEYNLVSQQTACYYRLVVVERQSVVKLAKAALDSESVHPLELATDRKFGIAGRSQVSVEQCGYCRWSGNRYIFHRKCRKSTLVPCRRFNETTRRRFLKDLSDGINSISQYGNLNY